MKLINLIVTFSHGNEKCCHVFSLLSEIQVKYLLTHVYQNYQDLKVIETEDFKEYQKLIKEARKSADDYRVCSTLTEDRIKRILDHESSLQNN